MNSITINAPCKINLSLDIVKRLPNGYHQMDMVMQTVSLCDTVTLSLIDDGKGEITIDCALEQQDAFLACDESNIAVRCARALLDNYNISLGGRSLHISLIKRIPMMAGLGGGSADGAAVMAGLNRLLGAGLTLERLEEIGLGCGADIPFCLRGGTQRAQGIGEKFTELAPMPDCHIVIIKPKFGISTGSAFKKSDSCEYTHADVEKMTAALQSGDIRSVAACLQNVFEALCSDEETMLINEARELLNQNGSLGSLLSGSGSALFGLFDDISAAEKCRDALSGNPLLEGVFLCKPVPCGGFAL